MRYFSAQQGVLERAGESLHKRLWYKKDATGLPPLPPKLKGNAQKHLLVWTSPVEVAA